MKKTAIAYWLLPAKPERDLFREVARILRQEFGAPKFEPHLTLFVATRGQQSPAKILRQVRSRPIRLNIRGVAFSPKFTKTLFVRFKSNEALGKLAIDVGRAAKSRARSPADPHVSLLYKNIPRATKKGLAAVIKLPFGSMLFDTVAATRLILPIRSGTDVEKWRIVASKKLGR